MAAPLEAKYKLQLLLDDALRSLRQFRTAYQETLNPPAGGTGAAAPAVKQAKEVADARKKAAKEVTEAEKAELAAQAAAARQARQAELDAARKARAQAAAERKAELERERAERRKAAEQRAADEKKARAEANLSRQVAPQLTDITVGLATGQNPLMVALQQGGQLKDLYGGLGNLGRAILGAFTPLRVLIGSVGAGIVALATAAVQGYRETDKLNKTLALTGNVAGLTAGSVEQSAKRIAAAQNAAISDTRDALVAGAALGTFTSSTLDSAARAATALSKLTGTAAAEQIADFQAMADGVAAWAEKANRSYNFLTAAEFARIRVLEASGREQEAMRLVLDKLAGTMEQRSVPALGALERAWRAVSKTASDYWDALKAIGRETTPEERLAQNADLIGMLSKGPQDQATRNRIAELQRQNRAIDEQRNRDLLRKAEQGIDAQAAQEDIKRQSQAYQDALAQIAQAGIQRRLANQQAGLDAQALLVERANARGLLTEEQYQVQLAQIDARRAQAEAAATRALIAQEQGRQYGTPQELRAQEARLEQMRAQLVAQESRAKTAAAQPALITDARMLADARDAAQKWADTWQQAFEQTRAFADENASTAALRLRDPVARAEAEAAASVAAVRRQLEALERDVKLRIDLTLDPDQRALLQQQLKALQDEAGKALGNRENAAKLASYRSAYATQTDTLRLQEEQLDDQVRRGQIGVVEAERAKNQARQASIPALQQLIDLMRRLAGNEDERNAVKALEQDFGRLTERVDAFRDTTRQAVGSGFGQMFADIATGAKSASQAFLGFLSNVARAALDFVGQQLGKQLANSLLPTGGGGFLSSVGSFVTSLFQFHDGGVIGAGGSARSLGIGTVLAAAAAGLPYYHSGGISGMGLRSNEELAVLQHGEEVLTADNPRHVKNFRAGGTINVGDIKVSVQIEGAGDVDGQAIGERLGAAVKSTVYEVLQQESREGGMLAGGTR